MGGRSRMLEIIVYTRTLPNLTRHKIMQTCRIFITVKTRTLVITETLLNGHAHHINAMYAPIKTFQKSFFTRKAFKLLTRIVLQTIHISFLIGQNKTQQDTIGKRMVLKNLYCLRYGISCQPVVGIHHANKIAISNRQPTIAGLGNTPIHRTFYHLNAIILPSIFIQDRQGIVCRTIVHTDDLKVGKRLVSQRLQAFGQERCCIIDRYKNRYFIH